MKFDEKKLSNVMKEMRRLLLAGDKGQYNTNVKNQTVIRILHDYIVERLSERTGIKTLDKIKATDKVYIDTEVKIPGSHKIKNVDIAIIHKHAGPLLLISIKSLMSSITNNFTNDFEAAIGDATSFHERYPYLVYGYIIIFPKAVLKRDETYDLSYYEKFLRKINNREDEDDKAKKYERVAMIVGDFKSEPPKLVKEIPADTKLRIETFIDDMYDVLQERYEMLKIL